MKNNRMLIGLMALGSLLAITLFVNATFANACDAKTKKHPCYTNYSYLEYSDPCNNCIGTTAKYYYNVCDDAAIPSCGKTCGNPVHYFVQAGAFRNYCHAFQQLDALNGCNFRQFAIYKNCSGLYVVRTTHMFDKKEAQSVQNQLTKRGFDSFHKKMDQWNRW